MLSSYTFKEYLGNYIRLMDLNGAYYTGLFLEGDYERVVLEPFVVDISEDLNGPEYQLTGRLTIPFVQIRSMDFITANRIRNVIIPGLNAAYSPGKPSSLYLVGEKRDFQLTGDGDGI